MAYEIKRNDRRPHWRVQLTANGDPVDLTGGTPRFTMRSGTGIKINRQPMTVIDAATGIVEYAWGATDTNEAASFNAEVEVDWGGGVFQSFPSKGYFLITVYEDLDTA